MKVLITVKTYPRPSSKYKETVCTAGLLEDGTWVRMYPLRLRSQRDYKEVFKKYHWLDIDLVPSTTAGEFRPNTYRPRDVDNVQVRLLGALDTGKDHKWTARKGIVLKHPPYTNLAQLIHDAYDPERYVSMAVFKPTKVLDVVYEAVDEKQYSATKQAALKQAELFQDPRMELTALPQLPYAFKYKFIDDAGKRSSLTILDWELGALYWKSLKQYAGDEQAAIGAVRRKYMDELASRDIYFFLGTTLEWHRRKGTNPFTIIGVFYPPEDNRLTLF